MARKVIIDCDPGIDDAVALIMALFDPRLDVVAVTACSGTVESERSIQNILGLDSNSVIPGVKQFLGLSGRLYDTINTVFKSTDGIQKDFRKAFQFVKYYFPSYG